MKFMSCCAFAVLASLGGMVVAEEEKDTKSPQSVHDFKVKSLDGREVEIGRAHV